MAYLACLVFLLPACTCFSHGHAAHRAKGAPESTGAPGGSSCWRSQPVASLPARSTPACLHIGLALAPWRRNPPHQTALRQFGGQAAHLSSSCNTNSNTPGTCSCESANLSATTPSSSSQSSTGAQQQRRVTLDCQNFNVTGPHLARVLMFFRQLRPCSRRLLVILQPRLSSQCTTTWFAEGPRPAACTRSNKPRRH